MSSLRSLVFRVLLLECAVSTSAPFPFRNVSLSWEARVADLVSRLTLEEKILQMQKGGAAANSPTPPIDRLGIKPFIWGSECVTGLGTDDASFAGTSYPQPLGMAATFDSRLIHKVADAISSELRGQNNEDIRNDVYEYHHGISCWSPVVNIMRHPLWGRNDETFGECPFLSGSTADAFVRGLQGNHTRFLKAIAGCKHFDVHGGPDSFPRSRLVFDANVSQRDWVTTFLPAFESCANAGCLGLMCSYNSIR